MASKDNKDDIELRIREAAAAGRIEMCETDEIENYDDIARKFLKDIFDINFDECFISDLSSLADFSTCCCPEEFDGTLKEINAAGDAEMQKRVNLTYGLEVDPRDLLITVFERIRQQGFKRMN